MQPDYSPKFASMNETDVREEIVRPLLTRLGYKHGTEAYVQTELPLSYSQAFLGRRNPNRDPILRGRADYICGVVAAGTWVIEVKRPDEALDRSTIQQAHTYAAHPEVAAYYFMLTNGKNFSVYETGRLAEPLLSWTFAESEESFLKILNLIGPDAIRKRAKMALVDSGEPLGRGLHSRLQILNGSVNYDPIPSDLQPPFLSSLAGVQLPVAGGWVARDGDRRIHACVDIASVSPLLKMVGAVGLGNRYDFYSSSSHISTEEEQPTIFQNFICTRVDRGTLMTYVGMPTAMPCSLETTAFTEVVGFVRDEQFQGTVRIEADLLIGPMEPIVGLVVAKQFGLHPGQHRIVQTGRFSARLASAI